MVTMHTSSNRNGFALVEILIALAILSISLLSLFSALNRSIQAVSSTRNRTRAIMIGRSTMNDFIMQRMRGPDIAEKTESGGVEFLVARKTERFEHPMLGPLPAKQTKVTVSWQEKGVTRSFDMDYIYASQ